jgi:hypothetical protein
VTTVALASKAVISGEYCRRGSSGRENFSLSHYSGILGTVHLIATLLLVGSRSSLPVNILPRLSGN